MNSWIDKYWKLKSNYKEEVKKLIQNENDMKISNHTVFNYSGKNLTIYIKKKKEYYKLAVIPQSK
jgi:hypothetical protein